MILALVRKHRSFEEGPSALPCDFFWIVASYGSFVRPAELSRRAAAGRAELLANFFGGAVWGVFRENANCGDPPG